MSDENPSFIVDDKQYTLSSLDHVLTLSYDAEKQGSVKSGMYAFTYMSLLTLAPLNFRKRWSYLKGYENIEGEPVIDVLANSVSSPNIRLTFSMFYDKLHHMMENNQVEAEKKMLYVGISSPGTISFLQSLVDRLQGDFLIILSVDLLLEWGKNYFKSPHTCMDIREYAKEHAYKSDLMNDDLLAVVDAHLLGDSSISEGVDHFDFPQEFAPAEIPAEPLADPPAEPLADPPAEVPAELPVEAASPYVRPPSPPLNYRSAGDISPDEEEEPQFAKPHPIVWYINNRGRLVVGSDEENITHVHESHGADGVINGYVFGDEAKTKHLVPKRYKIEAANGHMVLKTLFSSYKKNYSANPEYTEKFILDSIPKIKQAFSSSNQQSLFFARQQKLNKSPAYASPTIPAGTIISQKKQKPKAAQSSRSSSSRSPSPPPPPPPPSPASEPEPEPESEPEVEPDAAPAPRPGPKILSKDVSSLQSKIEKEEQFLNKNKFRLQWWEKRHRDGKLKDEEQKAAYTKNKAKLSKLITRRENSIAKLKRDISRIENFKKGKLKVAVVGKSPKASVAKLVKSTYVPNQKHVSNEAKDAQELEDKKGRPWGDLNLTSQEPQVLAKLYMQHLGIEPEHIPDEISGEVLPKGQKGAAQFLADAVSAPRLSDENLKNSLQLAKKDNEITADEAKSIFQDSGLHISASQARKLTQPAQLKEKWKNPKDLTLQHEFEFNKASHFEHKEKGRPSPALDYPNHNLIYYNTRNRGIRWRDDKRGRNAKKVRFPTPVSIMDVAHYLVSHPSSRKPVPLPASVFPSRKKKRMVPQAKEASSSESDEDLEPRYLQRVARLRKKQRS